MIRNLIPSAGLIGELVHSRDFKVAGQIEEIVIDTESSRVVYALLSFDRTIGVGEKWIAIPWRGIHMDLSQGGDGLIFDVSGEALRSAPSFTKGNWPNFADPQFEAELLQHFKMQPPQEKSRGGIQSNMQTDLQ